MENQGVSPPEKIGTPLRSHLFAFLIAALTSVLMTWPLAANASSAVLRAIYYWDAYTNAMIMGSRVDALLGRAALSLYDDYYFAPLPHSIVFNENHFGLSLIFAPFYLISKNPLFAYNLTVLVSLTLAAFFMYLLVRRLTGSGYAGVIAGVAYAYSPFVAFELGRIQLMAVQWIPAAFFFLHRAIESERRRDILGFWLCILLQIGTCLYYTMFLIPLLGLAAAVLLVRNRPSPRFFAWFGGAAVLAGAVALGMVYPYFAARGGFNLERSLAYASANDGKFGFFANVHPTNRTLRSMHHLTGARGAHDEIAFPGFTAVGLLCAALLVPAFQALARLREERSVRSGVAWLALLTLTISATLLTRSVLPGVLVFSIGILLFVRRGIPHPFRGRQGLYVALLLTATTMFLGLFPFEWRGEPVRGLYYYFHTYFPGFNGIRKVGRQASMTTFVVCVLAGFGGAWLFARIPRRIDRRLCAAVLLGGLCYELRCFPHPIERVWAADGKPAVFQFVASLPKEDLVASVPQDMGRKTFVSDWGMALHNYLALYHKHRFVNGQSSWQPPVTELARRAVERLPDDGARRALLSIGTRHLLVFGEDLPPARKDLAAQLAARPDEYRLAFQEGSHSVYTLLDPGDPSLELLPTPDLPPRARLIPRTELEASSALQPERARLAIDGDPQTYWTGRRFQQRGQSFEVALRTAHPIVALEMEAPGREMDVPVSFRVSASRNGEDLGVIQSEPRLRFYREQVFAPKSFVFRVPLPRPILADRLRITVEQGVPGSYFSIHELRLYEGSDEAQ